MRLLNANYAAPFWLNIFHMIGWHMKIIQKALLIILLFLIPLQTSALEWSSVGPFGGSTACVAFHPSSPATIYTGTASGIFKSIDGAMSAIVRIGLEKAVIDIS